MTLEYWEGDTLEGDHSRATNPSGTCKHEAQKPTSHMPQSETVCTDRQFIHHSTSCTSPQHHCGKPWLIPYLDVRSHTGEPVLYRNSSCPKEPFPSHSELGLFPFPQSVPQSSEAPHKQSSRGPEILQDSFLRHKALPSTAHKN